MSRGVCIYHRHDSARLQYCIFLMEKFVIVQLDRLVKEFTAPLEKQISSKQEEKQVAENEAQEIVGQKRRAHTGGTSSASKEMVAAGGTRRIKRIKVAPTCYAPVVEEESLEASPLESSGVVTRNTTLAASRPSLEYSSATDETTMNGSNEDTYIDFLEGW